MDENMETKEKFSEESDFSGKGISEESLEEEDVEEEPDHKKKIFIILAAFLFFLAATGCVFFFHRKNGEDVPEVPNGAPLVEIGAYKVPGSPGAEDLKPAGLAEDEDMDASDSASGSDGEDPGVQGTGAVTYGGEVKWDSRKNELSLLFQNPAGSGSVVTIGIAVDGTEVWRSGSIPEGWGVADLEDVDLGLAPGMYKCSILVDHYDPETGEKADFQLDLNAALTVS